MWATTLQATRETINISQEEPLRHTNRLLYMICHCKLTQVACMQQLFHYTAPNIIIWKFLHVQLGQLWVFRVFCIITSTLIRLQNIMTTSLTNTFCPGSIWPSQTGDFSTSTQQWHWYVILSIWHCQHMTSPVHELQVHDITNTWYHLCMRYQYNTSTAHNIITTSRQYMLCHDIHIIAMWHGGYACSVMKMLVPQRKKCVA
jgi:hypothetical protein